MRTAISEVVDEYDFILLDCPPSLVAAYAQRPVRGGQRAHSDAMRVLRARRAFRPRADHTQGARASESATRDRGPAAHDVRPAQHARAQRVRRLAEALRRKALSHRDSAQHPARRGAEPRHSGAASRRSSKGAQAYLALAGEMLRRDERPRPMRPSRCMAKLKGLGRGLDALLSGSDEARAANRCSPFLSSASRPASTSRARAWTRHSLAELAESIKAQGVMQPILVRPVDGGRFEIIAGERRWRAAQRAGLKQCPGAGAQRAGSGGAGAGADRKHPARRPESARGGAGHRAPDRRIQADARGRRRRRWAARAARSATCFA